MSKKSICIVGSGNWGSVIAKIIGNNVCGNEQFDDHVTMYVYEEMIGDKKLSEIINTTHENVKYLPGIKLPVNVVAITDVVEAAKDADVLVFVVPHQFVSRLCKTLQGKIKPQASAISLIKGLDMNEKGVDLISSCIRKTLNINCAVLMGANIASDVASEFFCEATVGCKDAIMGRVFKDLFQTPYFRIVVVDDEESVELCGALKNIVAVGAGFIDGLGFGDNTKAAVIRLGLMEMVSFIKDYSPDCKIDTFLESCGVADLITTCYSGRNRKVGEMFVKTDKTIEQLEEELLNGQKVQGPATAAEVYELIKEKHTESKFPLFVAIHKICTRQLPASEFITCLRDHPEHN